MVETMGITLVPLYIIVGINHSEMVWTLEDIFRYVDREGKTCKTAAVSTYEYMSTFSELLNKYRAVIHISLGSGFPAVIKTQPQLQNLKNVYVMNSRNAFHGSGLLVYDAALMADGLERRDMPAGRDNTRIDASL